MTSTTPRRTTTKLTTTSTTTTTTPRPTTTKTTTPSTTTTRRSTLDDSIASTEEITESDVDASSPVESNDVLEDGDQPTRYTLSAAKSAGSIYH